MYSGDDRQDEIHKLVRASQQRNMLLASTRIRASICSARLPVDEINSFMAQRVPAVGNARGAHSGLYMLGTTYAQ